MGITASEWAAEIAKVKINLPRSPRAWWRAYHFERCRNLGVCSKCYENSSAKVCYRCWKKIRIRRIGRGQCYYCSQPAETGVVTCRRHRASNALNARMWYANHGHDRRNEHKYGGLCANCTHSAVPGRVLCRRCLDMDRARSREPMVRSSNNALRRRQYATRKASGTCVRCGVEASVSGSIRCQECRDTEHRKRIERSKEE